MITLATIRVNNESDGELITISAIEAEYDGERGYSLHASNGDDIARYEPQTIAQLRADLEAMYSGWDSFERAY